MARTQTGPHASGSNLVGNPIATALIYLVTWMFSAAAMLVFVMAVLAVQ